MENLQKTEFSIKNIPEYLFDSVIHLNGKVYCFVEPNSKIYVFSLLNQSCDVLDSNLDFEFSRYLPFGWGNFIHFFSETKCMIFDIENQFWNSFEYFGIPTKDNSCFFPFQFENEIFFFPENCEDDLNFEILNSFPIPKLLILRKVFEDLITSKEETDVKVYLDDESSLNLHKCILYQSLYLKNEIDNSKELNFKKYSKNAIIEVLCYMYTNNFEINSLDSLLEMISISKKFQLVELEKMCYFQLKKFITKENMFSLYLKSTDNEHLKFLMASLIIDNVPFLSNEEEKQIDMVKETFKKGIELNMENQLNSGEYFLKLFEEQKFNDIEIQTSDKKIFKANSFILGLFTNFFKQKLKINIPFDLKTLELSYSLLKNKDFNMIPIQRLLMIIDAFSFMKLTSLKADLINYLEEKMDINNVIDIFLWSKNEVSNKSVKEKCEKFLESFEKIPVKQLFKEQNSLEQKISGIKNKLDIIQYNNEEFLKLIKNKKK